MRRSIALLAAAMIVHPAAAFADKPGKDWISVTKVAEIMTRSGYEIVEIEADDDHWEGQARRDGRVYDFELDPHSGQISKLSPDHA